MSKKNSYKKKINVKLLPGQAAFVADLETLQHIIDTYKYLSESAETKQEKESWLAICEDIAYWINETYYSDQDNGQEEEW
jgi:hypothetical protein